MTEGNDRGVPENHFYAFYQNGGKEGSYTQGTGLGMAIAKSMLDLMGEVSTLRVRWEKGSTFTVDVELETAEEGNAGRKRKRAEWRPDETL